jgi:hypothetical protein
VTSELKIIFEYHPPAGILYEPISRPQDCAKYKLSLKNITLVYKAILGNVVLKEILDEAKLIFAILNLSGHVV